MHQQPGPHLGALPGPGPRGSRHSSPGLAVLPVQGPSWHFLLKRWEEKGGAFGSI